MAAPHFMAAWSAADIHHAYSAGGYALATLDPDAPHQFRIDVAPIVPGVERIARACLNAACICLTLEILP